jgi:hypothetical protein
VKFLRDVAVNVVANLVAAAILYLVAVAADIFPTNSFAVFFALFLVAWVPIVGLWIFVVFFAKSVSDRLLYAVGALSGSLGVVSLAWSIYDAIALEHEANLFFDVLLPFFLLSVPFLVIPTRRAHARKTAGEHANT